MATFAKPEKAPKHAEELINVGQKQVALQAIHDLHFKEEEVIKYIRQLSTKSAERLEARRNPWKMLWMLMICKQTKGLDNAKSCQ
ncbi:uncharacterized protein LOC131252646 isoform X2 [Magnolia sinica]|uniref:uncharacterized protein LOC131252646 isoform X2 n=1 Tax=Magnolia sinica TaxID=86752 RepID=UPI002659ACF1|nr:uncharacterized protein LOC131252646 isoform X2 [Magnolia sinica]